MDYQYNYQSDPKDENGSDPQRKPPVPNKPNGQQDNDLGAWILIVVMFFVAWPVGLILLIKKLTDDPQRVKKAASDTAAHIRAKAQEQ